MNKKPNKKVTHQNKYFENDEIDLFSVMGTLLKFKLRIIIFSIIATFLGCIFYFMTPKSYELITNISPAKSSVFSEYFKLNRNIEYAEKIYSSDQMELENMTDLINISSFSIFENFVSEFSDYEEVKEILNQQKTINKIDLSELDESEKSKFINSLTKKFQILKPSKKSEDFTISILWHDPEEGAEIFDEITILVLQNLKTSLSNNVSQIPLYLEFIKKNKINLLEKEIISILNLQKTVDKQRILHLSEQAELARAMGLKKTLVIEDENFEILANDLIQFNYKNSSTDYLRGYEVLDKERELLQNRTEEELLLSNNAYSKIKNEIDLLLNNNFEDELVSDLDLIKNDSPYDWINYDLGLATTNPIHKSIYVYLFMSFLLGLTLSSFFTLIYSNFQDKKTHYSNK